MVPEVHVIPSGLVAHAFDVVLAVQNTLPFQAIGVQDCVAGRVRVVHVIPSGLVAALLLMLPATAQKTVPFHAIPLQDSPAIEPVVHVEPSLAIIDAAPINGRDVPLRYVTLSA
jgi:hypothetical protein